MFRRDFFARTLCSPSENAAGIYGDMNSSATAPRGDELFLAVEIGGTKLQVVAGTGAGKIRERAKFSVDVKAGAEGIRDILGKTVPEFLQRWQVRAIGVGFGGPVNWRAGRIAKSHHVSGWDEFAIGDWLAAISKRRVFVENDANVAALGETMCGAGRGFNPVFYVTIGSGVGGGLVCDGAIYHGAAPGEAEIGYLILDAEGNITEKHCSGWSLDKKIREAVAAQPSGELARRCAESPGHEARHLGAALAADDPLAEKILDAHARMLSLALSHVTHLFHPEIIVLGGGVSLIGEPLRAAVESRLRERVMDAFRPGPRVALSSLREDAVPVGALCLAAGELERVMGIEPT